MSDRARSPSRESRDDIAPGADGEAVGAPPSVTGQSLGAEPSAAPSAQPAASAGVSPPPSGAGSSSTDMLVDPATVPPMNLLAHIDSLKAEKRRLKDEKKQLTKTLKNAEKRRARLKRKARQLSDKDLADVMQLRESEQAAGKEKASHQTTHVQPAAAEVSA